MKEEPKDNIFVNSNNCAYCGSAHIVRNVRINQTGDAGRLGLAFRTGFLVTGTEPILADVCDDCGSLVRIFVEAKGKKWVTK